MKISDRQNGRPAEDAGALIFLALMAVLPLARGGVENQTLAAIMSCAAVAFSLTAISAVRRGGLSALRTPLDIPLAVLCVLALISYLGASYAFAGRLYIGMAASYTAFFYSLHYAYRDRGLMHNCLRALGAVAALYAVLGMAFKGAEIFGLEILSVKGYYISFTYGSHSHYAGFLVMGLWICVGFALMPRSGGERLFSGAMAAVIFSAVLISLSRGALIGLAGGAVFFMIAGLYLFPRKINIAVFIGLIALGISLSAMLGLEPVLRRLSTLSDPASAGAARLAIWKESVGLVAERPLSGFGPGMFPYAFPAYQTKGLALLFVNHAHNDYIEFAADMGGPALIAALWALGTLFSGAFSMLRKSPDSGVLGLAALSGCFSMTVHGFLDFNFFIPSNAMMFAALAAASLRPGGQYVKELPKDARPHWPAIAIIALFSILFLLAAIRFGLASRYSARAESALRAGGLMGAESYSAKAVSLNPGNAEHRKAQGDLYMELARRAGNADVKRLNYEKAASAYAEAADLCPVCGDYYSRLASALMRLKRNGDALDALDSAEEFLPHDPYLKRDLAEVLIALDQKAGAVGALAEAVGISPRLALPSARLLSESGIGLSEALMLRPEKATQIGKIAEASSRAGLDPNAPDALGEAFRLSPSPETAIAHLKALAQKGDINTALSAGKTYLESFPDDKEIKLMTAGLCLKAGLNIESARLYGELLEKNPDNAGIRIQLGHALFAERKYAEALDALRRGIGRGGTKDDARLYYGIALGLKKTGDYAGALEPAKKAVSASPEDPAYRYLLGEVYLRLGLGHEASMQWKACIEASPAYAPCEGALKKTSLK